VTNVLNAALAPFLNTTPSQPAPQNPVLWAVLAWVRRQIQDAPFGKIVLNRPPDITTSDVVENADGTFTITPSANDFDPDGDDLTYSAGNGQFGTVMPNGSGGFTYKPGEGFESTDSFTLTASDEGSYPHLHGLASLFNPNGGHTDTVTVNIQSSASLPEPDVKEDLAPLDDGSGNYAAELQYDETVTDVRAAFNPKYWRVVTQSLDEDGVYRVELEPTELGKLRAGLGLATDDELVLQVVKETPVQTMALKSAQVAALDVDPPEQAYQIPVPPPPAHFEVTNSGIQVGSNPAGVVVTDKYAYVANEQDGTVTVIDVDRSSPTFNEVVTTIPVGLQPFFAGLSGDRLYVVGSNTVSIVDTTTNQTVDTIPVAPKFSLISIPTNALVSPDGQKLYLLNANDGNVYVIDIDRTHVPDDDPTTPETYKSIIATIPVGSGFTTDGTYAIDFPISGGFSADGARLYIVRESIETTDTVHFTFHDGEVVVIDTTNDTVIGDPVDIGQFGGYAVSDGRYLYVPTFDSAELSAAYPEGAPRGYVTVVDISSNPDQPTVVDLNTSTPNVIDRLEGGALPLNVASSPDKSVAYVVNAGDGTITVIDTVNNQVLDMDKTTAGVQGVVFTPTPADDIFIKNVIGSTPDGTRLYVTNYTTNTVTALEIVDGLAPEAV
jgi:YVTN family beta-propeller protein